MTAPEEGTHVLLVEPDRQISGLIDELLRAGWGGRLAVTHAHRIADVSHHLATAASAVLLGGVEQFAALEHLRVLVPGVPVLLLGAEYADEAARLALRAGAQDFLPTGQITPSSLRRALQHAIERKRSDAQLAHRALQDPLTGLPNRTLFIDRLGIALERTRRTGAITGVLFLDVDHFKLINDSMGHDAGDRVLRALATRLRSVLRPMDTVSRFGGDEFTFLFEDLSSPEEALSIAERVQEAAAIPTGLGEDHPELAVSIGVATTGDAGISPDAIIRQADEAMYAAKGRGGGAATFASSVRDEAGQDEDPPAEPEPEHQGARRLLAEDLRGALERSELCVLYQPHYVIAGDRRVLGFEALVRWRHPEHGVIAPCDFLPLAEEIGITATIGQFVLGEALPLLARLRRARADLTVSVNVTRNELGDPELAAALAAVDAAGLHPQAVCLDIDETTVSQEPDTVVRAARLLKAAGVRLAIDDYGSGSAPLHSLRSLQADELKIDPRFVRELDAEISDGTMVAAVVELGHALGMTVTAEGVETNAQLVGLRTLGCDAAQGFLLSRPLAAEQLEQLIVGAA